MISLRTPLIAATLALAGWAGTAQAQMTGANPGILGAGISAFCSSKYISRMSPR